MRFSVYILLALSSALQAQNRPGFIYNQPGYQHTTGVISRTLPNGKTVVANHLTNDSHSGLFMIREDDALCLTIIDSTFTRIDTTIFLPIDTSSIYNFFYIDQIMVNNTLNILLGADPKEPSGMSPMQPSNVFFISMDSAYNLSTPKKLFQQDTVGIIYSEGVGVQYNKEIGLLETFLLQYDPITMVNDVILIRFDSHGNLQYYKKWNYTVHTQNQALISDYKYLSNGRYLLSQPVTNDIYVIADTAQPKIDTSYYKPEIRTLTTIRETPNSYVLMGTADGHKILSFEEGKLQYVFLKLDKTTLQEQSRHIYKIKDTLDYERIDGQIYRQGFHVTDDEDYIFTASEYCYTGPNSWHSFCSIYRMDSTANILWQYTIADTTYGEVFGGATLDPIQGTNYFLWHNAWYSTGSLPTKTWVMKFKADGSTFNLGLEDKRQLATAVELYPNPVQEEFMLLLPFLPTEKVEVQIFSMSGQEVQQAVFDQRDNLLKMKTSLPTGQYLVKVSSGPYQQTKKLVVEK